MADNENMDALHESHDVFKREQDEQLVQWMNRLFFICFCYFDPETFQISECVFQSFMVS